MIKIKAIVVRRPTIINLDVLLLFKNMTQQRKERMIRIKAPVPFTKNAKIKEKTNSNLYFLLRSTLPSLIFSHLIIFLFGTPFEPPRAGIIAKTDKLVLFVFFTKFNNKIFNKKKNKM